jgi:hypothetical protein
MPYYARVNPIEDKKGIHKVEDVIKADADFMQNYSDGKPGLWLKTDKQMKGGVYIDPTTGVAADNQSDKIAEDPEARERKNFASVGGFYDINANAFYHKTPFKHWVLNTTSYVWESPISKPTVFNDGQDPLGEWSWYWDDDTYEADNTKGFIGLLSTDTNDPKTLYDWNGTSWVART